MPSRKNLFRNPISHLFLIAIVSFLAYSNTFNVPFQFDDTPFIAKNPIIKNLSFFIQPSKAKVFNTSDIGSARYDTFIMRYIGYLTIALNYKIHGLDVTGYHIFNLTIHILNAILIYWLVILTLKTPYFAMRSSEFGIRNSENNIPHSAFGIPHFFSPINPFMVRQAHHDTSVTLSLSKDTYLPLFVALIFVCHPIQTQAVTYIYQRFVSLATFFYLLSLVMYIKFRIHDTKKMHDAGYTIHDKENHTSCIMNRESCIVSHASCIMYLASLFSAVLAMKTKEIAFTLPITITLYEFMFFNDSRFTIHDSRFKRILYLIPLLLTMSIIPLSFVGIDKPIEHLIISDVSEVTKFQVEMSRWDYLFTQPRVILTYIRLFFLPVNQNLNYDLPVFNSFLEPAVILSFLLLLAIFGLGIYLWVKGFKVQRVQGLKVEGSEGSNNQLSTVKPLNFKLISFGI
ncbi:MAG: hypothetical protein HY754_04755, partial [Nitrospirae bacterium]|nr:hypothetical protein [Nitrospirota bacterium]